LVLAFAEAGLTAHSGGKESSGVFKALKLQGVSCWVEKEESGLFAGFADKPNFGGDEEVLMTLLQTI
tara:strand:+ start:231 stop:431 length:201 start_codon:yes stop_codon:yes gene_type:complete